MTLNDLERHNDRRRALPLRQLGFSFSMFCCKRRALYINVLRTTRHDTTTIIAAIATKLEP